MAKLPNLPERIRQLHGAKWDALKEETGFTGDHLTWLPPPDGRSEIHESSDERPRWTNLGDFVAARKNDPAVCESYAIRDTVSLARKQFENIVEDHLRFWTRDLNEGATMVARRLHELAQAVLAEIREVWATDDRHTMWFDAKCADKVREKLEVVVRSWKRRISELEIERLQHPDMSLATLVTADLEGSMTELLTRLEAGDKTDVGRDFPYAAVAFESHPDFASKMHELLRKIGDLDDAVSPAGASPAPEARRDWAFKRFEAKVATFLELVVDLDSQRCFHSLVRQAEADLWSDYTGWPGMVTPLMPADIEFKEKIRRRIQWWIGQGYKRVATKTAGEKLETGSHSKKAKDSHETPGKPSRRDLAIENDDEQAEVRVEAAPGQETKWENVEIRFLSDERIQITTCGHTETRNYAEFGFEDGRSEKPNLAWRTLKSLAEQRGTMRPSVNGAARAALEKRIQEIRQRLRDKFRVADDPLPFTERIGYQARFKISCAASYNS